MPNKPEMLFEIDYQLIQLSNDPIIIYTNKQDLCKKKKKTMRIISIKKNKNMAIIQLKSYRTNL